MRILKKETAPRYVREEGIVSYLLASARTSSAKHLTATLVEIRPDGEQRVHHHGPEQINYILEGAGLMAVGGETARVGPSDCVFIPSGSPHGLKNDGESLLRYFSSAAPSFMLEEWRTFWPLASEAENQGQRRQRQDVTIL